MIADIGRIKGLISPKNAWILQLLEREHIKETIKVCHERLSIAEDPEIRLIYSLALNRLGYSVLAQEQMGQVDNLIRRLTEIKSVISEEFVAPVQELPLAIPILEEEIKEEDLEPETEPILKEPAIQELKDLSTPSLGELYAEQGAIEEAIEVYERYLELNPDDLKAKKRLKELKGLVKVPEERLINILEGWLANLKASFST